MKTHRQFVTDVVTCAFVVVTVALFVFSLVSLGTGHSSVAAWLLGSGVVAVVATCCAFGIADSL